MLATTSNGLTNMPKAWWEMLSLDGEVLDVITVELLLSCSCGVIEAANSTGVGYNGLY